MEDANARSFYLDECAKSTWSTKQLERQINSFYYQRLLSSQDKDSVRENQTLKKCKDEIWFNFKDKCTKLLNIPRKSVKICINLLNFVCWCVIMKQKGVHDGT